MIPSLPNTTGQIARWGTCAAMQHSWQRTCVVLWPPGCPGLGAPSRLHLTMTYGFSVSCLLVDQTKSDDFPCFKMKSFGGREETHKDMVDVFSEMFHWEKCFVHIGQHVGFPWSQSCSVSPASVDGEVSHGGHTVISWMLLDFCGSSFCTLVITRKLLSASLCPPGLFPTLSKLVLYSNSFFAFQVDIYLSDESIC